MKLQLQDVSGNVVEEKTLVLGEGDTLIMRFPYDVTAEQAMQPFQHVKEALEGKHSAVGLPNSIDFLILKVEK